MITRGTKLEDGKIFRFSLTARYAHWIHAIAYAMLFFTGMLLFTDLFDFMAPVFGGFARAQLIHRIFAVILVLPGIIFVVFDIKNFMGWMKECVTWTKDDKRALSTFIRELFGAKVQMPPQGYINAGQKINSILTVFVTGIIGASGLIIWFSGFFGYQLARGAYVVHSSATVFMVAVVIMHIYLGALNPKSKAAFPAMFTGYVDAEYVKRHHSKWYDEVTAPGKET